MRNRYPITIVVALLTFVSLIRAQTSSTKAIEGRGRQLAPIKLQLRTIVDVFQKTDKTQFGPNEDVTVQVLASNSGSTQAVLAYWRSHVHYLPTLLKAGEIVPYSKAMQERLAAFEEWKRRAAEPDYSTPDSASIVKLPSNQISHVGVIPLSNYYDKLQPGIYELKVKFRDRTGQTIESATMMFEVTPQ